MEFQGKLFGKEEPFSIAYFVTPHGFGHAARASAVMNAIYHKAPGANFHIFTTVPEWVFAESLEGSYQYHDCLTDVGIAQRTPLEQDLPETVRRLGQLYPLSASRVREVSEKLRQFECGLVICDSAVMGIAVAEQVGVPSVLVENFTWDWIYEAYVEQEPELLPFIEYLREIISSADFRIRTTPACEESSADLQVGVVFREPRSSIEEVRIAIEADPKQNMVLITMGGIEQRYPFLERLSEFPEITFVIPAASERLERQGNRILLPHHTPVYHPDLLFASDAVVGKVGYSTLAEVYHAGIPFAYVPRSGFRESPCLVEWIQRKIRGFQIDDSSFMDGDWISSLPELVKQPRVQHGSRNGADEIVEFLCEKELIPNC